MAWRIPFNYTEGNWNNMIPIDKFISGFSDAIRGASDSSPWAITQKLPDIIMELISKLDNDYVVHNNIAIHQSATIEAGAVIKGPVIIGEECFIGGNAYLRGGVYLGTSVSIGPGCEIKTSIIFPHTSIAHFNFIGDSIIGSHVNFEAGSHTANHYNERTNKRIFALYQSKALDTKVEKFGALVGDSSRIGANAVLSPGTILVPESVVKRLELVEQIL
jgi:NDP-sugar pyrophosphorylase family protein